MSWEGAEGERSSLCLEKMFCASFLSGSNLLFLILFSDINLLISLLQQISQPNKQ